MTTSIQRYARAPVLILGQKYGTSTAIIAIRDNIKNGNIRTEDYVATENERLDIIAGKFYGDGRLFWIIAAASEIGWVLQVPPGTLLRIPNLDDAARITG